MRQKLGEALKKARALSVYSLREFSTGVNGEGLVMMGVALGRVEKGAVIQTR